MSVLDTLSSPQYDNLQFLSFLAKPVSDDQLCLSLILSYASENGPSYPMKIGADYSVDQKMKMVSFLIRNHFADYKSTHCTPLPGEFFKQPFSIPQENDFVFT